MIFAAEGVPIKVKDIPFYMDEFFWSALHAWSMTKEHGLANGNAGWANEPTEYIDAISAINSAHNEVEREEMEKRMEEAKKPKSK